MQEFHASPPPTEHPLFLEIVKIWVLAHFFVFSVFFPYDLLAFSRFSIIFPIFVPSVFFLNDFLAFSCFLIRIFHLRDTSNAFTFDRDFPGIVQNRRKLLNPYCFQKENVKNHQKIVQNRRKMLNLYCFQQENVISHQKSSKSFEKW